MANLKIYSFFSGSGFLDLGFELSGYQIELVNEFSKSFIQAYEYSRKQMNISAPTFGYSNIDVNEYLDKRKQELERYVQESRKDGSLVGFIGGPPCPDFSVAGKQKGRNGDNGKLSLSYIKLIIAQQPDFFLFENVKGLWRTAKHRAFYEELKGMLTDAGYYLTERLTNSIEFGAPQDRDRILLFGINKKLVYDNSDPLRLFNWTKYAMYEKSVLDNANWPATDEFVEDGKLDCPDGVPKELTVQYWFDKNDVDHHPNAGEHFIPRAGITRMSTIQEGDDSRKSYKRLHRWRYSPTVAYGNNEVHLHPYRARRLTAAEAMALQSLPKEFTLPRQMTLSDKFKTIGNGVPFLLSKGIAQTISDYLKGGSYNAKDDSI